MEQESATTEKQNLEKRLQDESMGLHTSYSDLEISQLKAEIEVKLLYDIYFIIISTDKNYSLGGLTNFYLLDVKS